MKNMLDERKRDKLVNSIIIVSLIFIAVIMFLFTGIEELNITVGDMALVFRNMLVLMAVAEFIIIVLLLYRMAKK